VAVLVVDGFVTGHPGAALGDGMVSPEVVHRRYRLSTASSIPSCRSVNSATSTDNPRFGPSH
jgi:hypothetical protein